MKKEKILLMLLPFWDPQIPPPGIACLKSYLQQHGYIVRAVDANIEDSLKEIYHQYFDALRSYVPEGRQGNFNKIGFDVFHNHLMAHRHRRDEAAYIEALQGLVYTTFYVDFEGAWFVELDRFITVFFQRLEDYILRVLAEERPDVLGITVYTDTLPASLLAFRLAKENYPGIRTVMGGGIFASDMTVGTPNMAYFLEKASYVDKILVGEGERLLLKYLRGELPGTQKVVELKDIRNELLDIGKAGLPDFSDFHLEHYPYLATYTSRSCPFQCEFCTETQIWGKFRKKSGRQVVKELMTLYQHSGLQLFFMSDSLLNPIVTELAQELTKEETSIYWDGYLRVDRFACDPGYTMLWRRGGFYRARMGLESGSQHVLDLMNKKITVAEIKASISALADTGIKTTTYWLLGFPGESEADFQETLDLIEEMADDIYEVNCSPFWYFQNAQRGRDQWKDKSVPLYPEKARELFLLQTWIVDCQPDREEIYRRMWRFTEHCKKLGIPTPYSLQDFHKADLRWAELHKNAVPPMVWFGNKEHYIDENKKIKELVTAQTAAADDGDFGF
jgi:radical SAM superfamily enzyme YgiQ (UPF0313 family)